MCGDYVDSVFEDGSDPYGKEASYSELSPSKQQMVDEGKLEWSEEYKDWYLSEEEYQRQYGTVQETIKS